MESSEIKTTVNTSNPEIDLTVLVEDMSHEDALESIPDNTDFTNRYAFIGNFAEGGVGKITKWRDLTFNRVVAMKCLKKEFENNSEQISAFLRECKLNAMFDHPSIIPVYDMGKDANGKLHIAEKFVKGVSLYEYMLMLREKYDLTKVKIDKEESNLKHRLEIFLKISEVVEYCHSIKISHGDIKPENILIGDFWETYLLDWGCAAEFESTQKSLKGTTSYLPPEYLKHKKVTPQLDVFSLGVLLYEISTLRRVKSITEGKINSSKLLESKAQENVWQHHYPKIRLNKRMISIIQKATSFNPENRYKNISEFSKDVRRYIYDEEISVMPDNFLVKMFRKIYRNRIKTLVATIIVLFSLFSVSFHSYYSKVKDKEAMQKLTQSKLKMQKHFEDIINKLNNNISETQMQLLLLADNLLEDVQEECLNNNSKIYFNEDYLNEKDSPPNMIFNENYADKINLENIVIIGDKNNYDFKYKIFPNQMVTLCKKITNYNFDGEVYFDDRRFTGRNILENKNWIHCLFMKWRDGSYYIYPGLQVNSYVENMMNDSFTYRNNGKNIVWSQIFPGKKGALRMNCRYAVFQKIETIFGMAGLQIRIEKFFAPLSEKNFYNDNVQHFLIDRTGTVIAKENEEFKMLESDAEIKNGLTLEEIRDLAKNYKGSIESFKDKTNNKEYYYLCRNLKEMGTYLLQIIDANKINQME